MSRLPTIFVNYTCFSRPKAPEGERRLSLFLFKVCRAKANLEQISLRHDRAAPSSSERLCLRDCDVEPGFIWDINWNRPPATPKPGALMYRSLAVTRSLSILRKVCQSNAEGVFLSVTPSAVNVPQTVLCDGSHAEGVPHKITPSANTPHTFRAKGGFGKIIVSLTSK